MNLTTIKNYLCNPWDNQSDAIKLIFRTITHSANRFSNSYFLLQRKRIQSKLYFTKLLVHCLLQSIAEGINGKSSQSNQVLKKILIKQHQRRMRNFNYKSYIQRIDIKFEKNNSSKFIVLKLIIDISSSIKPMNILDNCCGNSAINHDSWLNRRYIKILNRTNHDVY